jgi:hypothetical protein
MRCGSLQCTFRTNKHAYSNHEEIIVGQVHEERRLIVVFRETRFWRRLGSWRCTWDQQDFSIQVHEWRIERRDHQITRIPSGMGAGKWITIVRQFVRVLHLVSIIYGMRMSRSEVAFDQPQQRDTSVFFFFFLMWRVWSLLSPSLSCRFMKSPFSVPYMDSCHWWAWGE